MKHAPTSSSYAQEQDEAGILHHSSCRVGRTWRRVLPTGTRLTDGSRISREEDQSFAERRSACGIAIRPGVKTGRKPLAPAQSFQDRINGAGRWVRNVPFSMPAGFWSGRLCAKLGLLREDSNLFAGSRLFRLTRLLLRRFLPPARAVHQLFDARLEADRAVGDEDQLGNVADTHALL